MVLDTSAIVGMILREPDSDRLEIIAGNAAMVLVGAPSVLEAGMVLSSRLRQDARPVVQALLRHLQAKVVPFDDDHAWAATGTFLRFGRARHAANLNFGDCMSYAVASLAGQPLLFVGEDFSKTDIARV